MSAISIICQAIETLEKSAFAGAKTGCGVYIKGATAYSERFPLKGIFPARNLICGEKRDGGQPLSVMRCEGCGCEPLALCDSFDLLDLARLIESVACVPADEVYTDYFYRIRAGCARGFAYADGDTLAAVAFADYISSGGAVLGSVCVAESMRGSALGARLCASAAIALSGEVYLICEPPLCGYYARHGFTKTETIYRYAGRLWTKS